MTRLLQGSPPHLPFDIPFNKPYALQVVSLTSSEMCYEECLVNRHRGCGHDVLLYYTGSRFDCNSSNCALSKAHRHTARNCGCPKTYSDHRKVANIIQEACEDCRTRALAAHIRNTGGRA